VVFWLNVNELVKSSMTNNDEDNFLIKVKLLEKCCDYLRIIGNKGKGRKNG